MVKGHHDQNILALIVLGSILHRRQGGMYRRKIIHAPGCNELLSCPKDLTAGGIGRNQVEGCNILLADARLLPHYLQDRRLWVTDAEDWLHVVLAVWFELILAVQVDGQRR